jgi:hypothetical protein
MSKKHVSKFARHARQWPVVGRTLNGGTCCDCLRPIPQGRRRRCDDCQRRRSR